MSDTPMTYSNEHDDDGIHDVEDHTFRNRVVAALLSLIAIAIIATVVLIIDKSQKDAMLAQLPGVTVVESGATLVDYVVGNGDNEDRLQLAIFAAERMEQPLSAVETEVAGKDKLLPVTYGTVVPVTYDQARALVAHSDRVKISMSLHPGDLLDPKRGEFIPRDDPRAVLDYIMTNTTCGSYEQNAALAAFNAANAPTVVTPLCGAG